MPHEQRIWSLSIASELTYGGNTGYDDLAMSVYRYDNLVQYHAQVSEGDLVLGATLIGDARVTADDDDPGVKMCGQRPSDTIEARAVPRPTTWS